MQQVNVSGLGWLSKLRRSASRSYTTVKTAVLLLSFLSGPISYSRDPSGSISGVKNIGCGLTSTHFFMSEQEQLSPASLVFVSVESVWGSKAATAHPNQRPGLNCLSPLYILDL